MLNLIGDANKFIANFIFFYRYREQEDSLIYIKVMKRPISSNKICIFFKTCHTF